MKETTKSPTQILIALTGGATPKYADTQFGRARIVITPETSAYIREVGAVQFLRSAKVSEEHAARLEKAVSDFDEHGPSYFLLAGEVVDAADLVARMKSGGAGLFLGRPFCRALSGMPVSAKLTSILGDYHQRLQSAIAEVEAARATPGFWGAAEFLPRLPPEQFNRGSIDSYTTSRDIRDFWERVRLGRFILTPGRFASVKAIGLDTVLRGFGDQGWVEGLSSSLRTYLRWFEEGVAYIPATGEIKRMHVPDLGDPVVHSFGYGN